MPYKDMEVRKKYSKEYSKKWYLKNKSKFIKKCDNCGCEYGTRYSSSKYCSKKCFYLGNRCKQICINCGILFYAPDTKKRKFCSNTCHNKYLHKNKEYRKNWFIKLMIGVKNRDTSNIGKNQFGERNPLWKGGITPKYHCARTDKKYLDWRKSIFERDNYTCQECGSRSCKNHGVILQAHHKIPFYEIFEDEKLLYSLDNGITLCLSCHRKTDSYGKNSKKEPVLDKRNRKIR